MRLDFSRDLKYKIKRFISPFHGSSVRGVEPGAFGLPKLMLLPTTAQLHHQQPIITIVPPSTELFVFTRQ